MNQAPGALGGGGETAYGNGNGMPMGNHVEVTGGQAAGGRYFGESVDEGAAGSGNGGGNGHGGLGRRLRVINE